MKAKESQLLKFIRNSSQFIIPIYQRTYSWTERECEQLWHDIVRAGSEPEIKAHFVGSIVYIEDGLYQVSSVSPLLVIDGQQRLTTVILLLEALSDRLKAGDKIEGTSAERLVNYYLINDLENGDDRFKLLLTQTDRDTLISLTLDQPLPADASSRLAENHEFFLNKLGSKNTDLEAVWAGLRKLMIVDVSLSRENDNPQLIFESMNSTGRELSQADLIRNFILMGLEPKQQTELYERAWRPMEIEFGQESYGDLFDSFVRHYLTMKTGVIPVKRKVYESFKTYANRPEIAAGGVAVLVEDIYRFARHYCAMALGQESDPELAAAFRDLRELKVDVAYPLLLELYDDYQVGGLLDNGSFERVLRLIESYVFRRVISQIPTHSLNKTFANAAQNFDKERYLESIEAWFQKLPSYRRFPSDDEFEADIKTKDLYTFARRSFMLRRLENHGRKERVEVEEYTIEHILPQNKDLPKVWRDDLGPDWERIHEAKLHTLGNLTLTGYNSEYSDRPFLRKRDMEGGFSSSPLRLNAGLAAVERWDEAAINERADRLAKIARDLWIAPSLSAEELARHTSPATRKARGVATYTIEDHPHLKAGGHTRQLFDAFRIEVLALDETVTESYMKLYVAYKAETNFVDVVPQAKRLRLTIGLDFHELRDPKGIAEDITDRGRWGNGNVGVVLSSLEELPYILGLVRQSLESQMDARLELPV